ncbi:family 10 glycosylhydrolase [Paenibacillus spiritus]|uniref:Family 10 glycosylhydrolase n=1 Tax=Paenibacillus spiritus TaxID=2496557 RepID=A0A5J5GH07_9BACL|nr:family 10 glycosylhydrolase [Paenibacillus spiritus]KAA9007499.1 family 10 glycosylhydrolase [Paenibacillus spiritus]
MRIRKWLLPLLLLALVLPALSAGGARAASAVIGLELDGSRLESDVPPYLTSSNVTMVPLAVISRGLGAGVQWNQQTKTVSISKNGTAMSLTSGQKTALVDGDRIALDTSVVIRQGRIMVPIRFVSEQLGMQVVWDKAARTVRLYSGAETAQPSAPTVPVPSAPSAPSIPSPSRPTTGSAGGAADGLRGVWISTVFNLDWPSAGTAGNPDRQKQEFTAMLDKLKAVGFNAVFVQLRPSGDALYPSTIVPWSKALSGKQGVEPGYDPLAFMVAAAHERGMQFHAWFNPFRATTDTKAATLSALSSLHVVNAHPEWIVKADDKMYINPGIPAARQHIIDTILETVRGYDIDGVHLDDYFYPSGAAFADDAAFAAYNPDGIALKADWRRDNINRFVRDLGRQIHELKPDIAYGISPFGVWRNAKTDSTGSDTAAGVTAYDSMYADVRTWIRQGWIDYVAPQVYWSLTNSAVRYDKLVDWWTQEVEGTGVKLYIGMAAYKIGADSDKAWLNPDELIRQLQYNASKEGVAGSILFRAGDLVTRNPYGISDLLKAYFQS